MAAASVADRQALLEFVQFQEQHEGITPAQALRMFEAQTGQASSIQGELGPSLLGTRNPETSRAIPRNLSVSPTADILAMQTDEYEI